MARWIWLTLPLALACGDGDGSDTEGGDGGDGGDGSTETLDPATVPLGGPCDLAKDYGGFEILSADDAWGVQGAVSDGVVPQLVLEEIMSDGDCTLKRRNNPFCDPPCDAGETCDFDGECLPYPQFQDLGTVTVDGLVQPVSMEPVFPGNTYFDTSVPNPPFTPGEAVRLNMPGGLYGPAELFAVGVEPLEGMAAEWIVEAGVDLPVTWDAPSDANARSEIYLTLSVDQHGTTPGAVFCTFADTGSGTVPGTVIQALVDSGVTGFPTGGISRRTVDQAPAGDGCMDLTLHTPKVVAVDVVGFTPCWSDIDCPEGQDCNEELQVCE